MRHIAPLFDHLVGAGEQRERDAETERLCDLNVRQRAASATALGMIAFSGSECGEDGWLDGEITQLASLLDGDSCFI